MKILIATDTYCYVTNGVGNVVIALEEGLRRCGHDVKVLTLANKRASFRDGGAYFIRSRPSLLYPGVRMSAARSDPLLDELIQWKPDVVHLHTEASVAHMARKVAHACGAPLIMTVHTDYAYYAFGRFHTALPVRALMRTLGKRVYRGVSAVTVPSEKARSFPQIHSVLDRVDLVPNGIKLEQYQKPISPEEKEALFRRWGLKDNGCTLVMVTRVSREKNIQEVLRFLPSLLREVPGAQLLIVGDGPYRKHLEKACAEGPLRERVAFTGRIPPEEVYRYYDMGDLFVSASLFEVHSLSCLEAMACGLPLVCREDDSLLGVLENGENGFLYRTEQEFVRAVKTVLADPAVKENMRKNALEKVRSFSHSRFVENMAAEYERVLRRAKP